MGDGNKLGRLRSRPMTSAGRRNYRKALSSRDLYRYCLRGIYLDIFGKFNFGLDSPVQSGLSVRPLVNVGLNDLETLSYALTTRNDHHSYLKKT